MVLIKIFELYLILQKNNLYDDFINYCTNKKGAIH